MKDRKTILYFIIPFALFLFGAVGALLIRGSQKAPAPPQQVRTAAATASIEELQLNLNTATLEELTDVTRISMEK